MQFRFQSNPMVYAPNVIRMAQAYYRGGDTQQAIDIVQSWKGIPTWAAEKVARGEVVSSRVDDEEALIVVVEEG